LPVLGAAACSSNIATGVGGFWSGSTGSGGATATTTASSGSGSSSATATTAASTGAGGATSSSSGTGGGTALCATGGMSSLPGVSVVFPDQPCTFTLAQAAAGIHVDYQVVVAQGAGSIVPKPQDAGGCGHPGASG